MVVRQFFLGAIGLAPFTSVRSRDDTTGTSRLGVQTEVNDSGRRWPAILMNRRPAWKTGPGAKDVLAGDKNDGKGRNKYLLAVLAKFLLNLFKPGAVEFCIQRRLAGQAIQI